MKSARRQHSARSSPSGELTELRARLADAEETLRAIRAGEVDAVVVAGKEGPKVFTLEGAEHAYRVLIESMNEGALTLTAGKMILYANQCFARMVKCPLEQVMGGSIRRFLSGEDQAKLRLFLKRADKSGSKIQVVLKAGDGSQIPAHMSVRALSKNGCKTAIFTMVVTDMTEARRTEELLRALTHRVVQAHEAERGQVALELHDNITQLICAVLVRIHTLSDKFSSRDGPSKKEVAKLRKMLGQTTQEVERISRYLRPSILDNLGLVAVLRETCAEFAERTGLCLKLDCVRLTARLPADAELALYRVLQEALRNVETHARARHVNVCLTRQGSLVQLVINDDGNGFDPVHPPDRPTGKGGLGLLGLRERMKMVGGRFNIKSVPGAGSSIEAQVPSGRAGGARMMESAETEFKSL